MKALSLWQPWASWVAWGWKTIETRTHPRFRSLVGQTIAIHAAKRWDEHALTVAWPFLTLKQYLISRELPHHRQGHIVAVAEVVKCARLRVEDADAALSAVVKEDPRFGLQLSAVRSITAPIYARGRQGIWTLSPEEEAAVNAALARKEA